MLEYHQVSKKVLEQRYCEETQCVNGEGIALFREEVAKGMSKAAEEMKHAGLDTSFILFSMWTDAIKHFAEHGKGNVIFLLL